MLINLLFEETRFYLLTKMQATVRIETYLLNRRNGYFWFVSLLVRYAILLAFNVLI